MPTIVINGQNFDTDHLSEEIKNLIGSIRFIDNQITQLQQELAVIQTARQSYARALTDRLAQDQLITMEGKGSSGATLPSAGA